jgi:hypothetical protein
VSKADRKLLELAAKAAAAAGLPIIESVAGPQILYRTSPKKIEFYRQWNPLIDEGDALRLAVKLRILVDPRTQMKSATSLSTYSYHEAHSDEFEATRRAIVRAAAAIGEAMP